MVSGPLPADLAEGVVGASAVELVDGHHIGQLQHVDLLELGGCTVLRCHHVERDVGDLDHGGITLADAGGLHDDQVESGRSARRHDQGESGRQLGRGAPGGHGPEEDAGSVDGVHPDPVPEQGASAPAPGGVHGQHGDGELVLLIEPETSDQLVGQGRLTRATGAGDAQNGDRVPIPAGPQHVGVGRTDCVGLDAGDPPGQCTMVAGVQGVRRGKWTGSEIAVALLDQEVDHPVEAEPLPVGGREDALHAVGLELLDLRGHDDPAPTPVDQDVFPPLVPQSVDQVAEVLHVAALVGADGHTVDVLVDGRPHHLVHRSVVAEVDHLRPLGLQETAHDVDGGVVTVEQAGRGHEPHRVCGPVQPGHSGPCSGPDRRTARAEGRSMGADYYNVLLTVDGSVTRRGARAWPGPGRQGRPCPPGAAAGPSGRWRRPRCHRPAPAGRTCGRRAPRTTAPTGSTWP